MTPGAVAEQVRSEQQGTTDTALLDRIDAAILTTECDGIVVEAIVSLADEFGDHAIANGVESDEVLRVLADLGVHNAQGDLLGKPAPLGRPTNARSVP